MNQIINNPRAKKVVGKIANCFNTPAKSALWFTCGMYTALLIRALQFRYG